MRLTLYGWFIVAAMVLIAACLLLAFYEAWQDRRTQEMQAVLDELAGDYHSPADRMAALEALVRPRDTPTEVLALDSVTPTQVVCPTVPNWNPRPPLPHTGSTVVGKHRAPDQTEEIPLPG